MTRVSAVFDPVALAQALVREPSVTPDEGGAMALVEQALEGLGFHCRRLDSGGVANLYARRGHTSPNLCFAGHTDVVPAGDAAAWTHEPFAGLVENGLLHGRGAADMKGGIAAWIAAVAEVGEMPGSLSLLITGDEEGPAVHGTRWVVETLKAQGERLDHCVVGEPTSVGTLGDQIKVGRRGSLNAWITVEGRQGHVAYPHLAANPIRPLVALLSRLQERRLDDGWPEFPPSNLEVSTVDVGNPAGNVIPAQATARLNIRFNPNWVGADLVGWLEEEARRAEAGFDGRVRVEGIISGEAFLTPEGPFIEVVSRAVEDVIGVAPEASTGGGTSDARFIKDLCPTVELGLVGATIHAVDERTPVADVLRLRDVYARLIRRYFETFR